MEKKVNKMENENRKQTTLFGGFVKEEQQPLTFVKVYEEVASDGDQFTMAPTTATLNEEKGCITLVDTNKSQALTTHRLDSSRPLMASVSVEQSSEH